MRVIECNRCGALLTAADDDELVPVYVDHMSDEHDEDVESEDAHDAVAERAYDAGDS